MNVTSDIFFDFEYLLRTEKLFQLKIEKAVSNIIKTNNDVLRNGSQLKYKRLRDEAFFEYLKLSRFNITPLLGYFFPRYPSMDPFSLKDHPYAHVLYNLNVGLDSSTTIRGSRQIGKCVIGDTLCKFRHKFTGKIVILSIKKFYDSVASEHIPVSDNKIIESKYTNDWEVLSKNGFVDIQAVHKTIPFNVWYISTKKNYCYCADNHIFIKNDMSQVYAKDCLDTEIITENGIEKVIKVDKLSNLKENMYDLELSKNSEHVYYTNGILSHNTTNDGISMRIWSYLLPGIKMATIVPRTEQLKTIADKYQEIDNAFRFKSTNSKFRTNLYYKEYPGSNGLVSINRLWYILTSADKIRGNTYDWIYFDEYQDFDMSLEPQIYATQSQSLWRSTRYAGTSKSTDTALEYRWLESSRGYWRMTCPHCNYDNYPSVNYGIFDMIKPNGVCCKKCGRLLNVRNGRWDFECPQMLDLGKWGFHIPQIIVPANTENKDKWLNIYKAAQYMDKKSFLEEYLGEATEQGSKELTTHELQDICILGDIGKLQDSAKNINEPKYLFKISGCDWGGSDYNQSSKTKTSYTAHVIIGVTSDYKFDLIYAKTYAGMAWDDISQSIAKVHKDFRCYALANDHGGGAVYVNELLKWLNPLRVVKFKYKGPIGSTVSIPKNSEMPNLYILNRTESITSLFLDIKHKRLRAPRWEHIGSYLSQCLNTSRIPFETPDGTNTLKYVRNPTKPDDIMHALNLAIVLAKMLLNEPLFKDEYTAKVFNEYVKYGRTPNQLKVLRNNVANVSMG